MNQHCVVITCFDAQQPGYLDFLYRIRALTKVYRVTVLSQQAHIHNELFIDHVHYHNIPNQGGKLGWLTYLYKSAAYTRKLNADVVVLLHSALAPMTMLLGKVPHCLYWNEHPSNLMHMPTGFSPIKTTLTWVMHKCIFLGAKHAQLVMPIGEDHQADLIANGVATQNIEIQYMGVDDQFLATENASPQTSSCLSLVYTGTVSVARGQDVMLEAMQIVMAKTLYANVHLTIVGASPQALTYCQEKIIALGLQGHVEVIGRVSGDVVRQYLRQADAAVCLWQPNTWNMFNPPTKLFEYLVAGLPVLASNIRTHTRYISHGKTGFVFEYHAQGLADAIQMILHQQDKLSEMKQNARDAGQHHLWSRLEAPFLAAVRRVHTHAIIQ